MTLDFTKPVQTRDGRKARIFATDYKGLNPIIGAIQEPGGGEFIYSWSLGGKAPANPGFDLVNVPQKFRLERWVNVYRDGQGYHIGADFETRDFAVNGKDPNCVATVPITIEGTEGEGL